MSRRRYISTDISTDTAVNRLAMKSDFAALLYTWMIPHCGDDACIPADAEEILLLVMPGRRDKTPEDIEEALRLMQDFGLIYWEDNGKSVNYPPDAFYKYQSYIKNGERRGAHNTAEQRENDNGANNSAEQRNSAHNSASFKSSFSLSSSVSSSSPVSFSENAPPTPQGDGDGAEYPDDFEQGFWQHYPKGRGGKLKAFQHWKKLTPSQKQAATNAIPAFLAGRDWMQGFHKAPEIWLRDRHWENPPPPMVIVYPEPIRIRMDRWDAESIETGVDPKNRPYPPQLLQAMSDYRDSLRNGRKNGAAS